MKKSLKIARSLQLVGCLLLVVAIVSCSNGGIDGSGLVSGLTLLGILLIIIPRAYEWLNNK